jgi:hypothetical protein
MPGAVKRPRGADAFRSRRLQASVVAVRWVKTTMDVHPAFPDARMQEGGIW